MRFATETASDRAARGGRAQRNGGQALDFATRMRVVEYLRANQQQIIVEQPTRPEVCQAIRREIGIEISEHSLRSTCKAIGFTWKSRHVTTDSRRLAGRKLAKTHGTMSYGITCKLVRALCQKNGIEIPTEGGDVSAPNGNGSYGLEPGVAARQPVAAPVSSFGFGPNFGRSGMIGEDEDQL